MLFDPHVVSHQGNYFVIEGVVGSPRRFFLFVEVVLVPNWDFLGFLVDGRVMGGYARVC